MTDPIFDYTGASSPRRELPLHPDHAAPSPTCPRSSFPSVQNPKKVLCIKGNYSTPLCMKGALCNNTYAIPHLRRHAPQGHHAAGDQPRGALQVSWGCTTEHSRLRAASLAWECTLDAMRQVLLCIPPTPLSQAAVCSLPFRSQVFGVQK